MTLNDASIETEYVIKSIETDDEEMKSFLLTLGCYEGETITVVSKRKNNMTLSLKDARYSIDSMLAEVIVVE